MRFLKRTFCGLSLVLALSLAVGAFEVGCKSTPQRIAFKTIGSVDAAAKAAYSGYMDSVLSHSLPTNGVPRATALYKQVEQGCVAAELVSENGTNALSPQNLTDELSQLLAFVASVTAK